MPIKKIIPSVKLKMVTVHKLQDLSCQRYYYWRWIRNIEPRKMNINFWYGSVFHAGFQTLLMQNLNKAMAAMQRESKDRLKLKAPDNDMLRECSIQLRLIKTIMRAASRQPFMKRLEMDWAEKKFSIDVHKGVQFCSTLDGIGRYKDKPVFFEIKTAKTVSPQYFQALSMDSQIYGYALQLKYSDSEPSVNKVAYCVFRKSGKYLKRGQGEDEFVEEITQDIKERPDWYFIVGEDGKSFPLVQTIGKTTLAEAEKDLVENTRQLYEKYQVKTERLLDPSYWPKNCKHCLNYGACQFLPLCQNIRKYELYMRFYQQRELRYDLEHEELGR